MIGLTRMNSQSNQLELGAKVPCAPALGSPARVPRTNAIGWAGCALRSPPSMGALPVPPTGPEPPSGTLVSTRSLRPSAYPTPPPKETMSRSHQPTVPRTNSKTSGNSSVCSK